MEYENVISAVLRYLGVGQSYQGYEYVVDGIRLVLEDSDRLKYITKSLYPDIAKKELTYLRSKQQNISSSYRLQIGRFQLLLSGMSR